MNIQLFHQPNLNPSISMQADLKQIKADFDRDGYAVIPGFLDRSEMSELLAEIERYARDVVPGLPRDEAFYEIKGQPETFKYFKNMSRHAPYFAGMFSSRKFEGLAEMLLDDTRVVGQNLSLFNKPPRVGDCTPAHQDGYYFHLNPCEALTLWLAVDRVDEENGCVRYVPGSHRAGMRPHRKTATLGFSQGIADYGPGDEAREKVMRAEPGDLLVHHGMTIHRADPNHSDRTRRAIGMVYYSSRAKTDEEHHRKYQEQLERELVAQGKI